MQKCETNGERWTVSSDNRRSGIPIHPRSEIEKLVTKKDLEKRHLLDMLSLGDSSEVRSISVSQTMAASDARTEFLSKYETPSTLAKFAGARGAMVNGKILVLDYPFSFADRYIARVCIRLRYNNAARYCAIVANEFGAVIGALTAAGYTTDEIVNLRVNGVLDVIGLVENGQRLPDALHVSRKGGAHKGFRFRDCIDSLIREKIGGDASSMVTFAELASAAKKTPLVITALNVDTGLIEGLSAKTYPNMPVATAVLASCAISGYIGRVEYTNSSKHTFACGSVIQSLPMATARQFHASSGARLPFASMIIGFGYMKPDTDTVRASANFKAEVGKAVRLL